MGFLSCSAAGKEFKGLRPESGNAGSSFIHAFLKSFNHSFVHSFNQSINQSINQSFNQSINQSIMQSLNHLFIQSFIHSLIHWAGGNEGRAEGAPPRERALPPPPLPSPSPDPSSCPSRPVPLGASPAASAASIIARAGEPPLRPSTAHHCARAGTNLKAPPDLRKHRLAPAGLTGRCTRAGCS